MVINILLGVLIIKKLRSLKLALLFRKKRTLYDRVIDLYQQFNYMWQEVFQLECFLPNC